MNCAPSAPEPGALATYLAPHTLLIVLIVLTCGFISRLAASAADAVVAVVAFTFGRRRERKQSESKKNSN